MGGGPRDEEQPRHRVTVGPYRLARAPVTRSAYQSFLESTGHEAPPFWDEPRYAKPGLPAVGPSWDDAIVYCAWLGAATGEHLGLPTEAEWEYAALAGREATYPWGNGGPDDVEDYDQRWREGPEAIDLYPCRHPWGFVGLGENVHEWCADWYDARYYAVSPERDPQGPKQGRRRASRGGSWRHAVKVTRCAARSSIPPHMRYADYGFRLRAPAPRVGATGGG